MYLHAIDTRWGINRRGVCGEGTYIWGNLRGRVLFSQSISGASAHGMTVEALSHPSAPPILNTGRPGGEGVHLLPQPPPPTSTGPRFDLSIFILGSPFLYSGLLFSRAC